MAHIYEYKKPKDRMLSYIRQRKREIEGEIEQLNTERVMLTDIESIVLPLVCDVCLGEGSLMRAIEGCEIDGPRLHTCPKCKGLGEPTS
jgi:hypothetical protein